MCPCNSLDRGINGGDESVKTDEELMSILYKQIKDLIKRLRGASYFKQTGPNNLGATEGIYIHIPCYILKPNKPFCTIDEKSENYNVFMYPNTEIGFKNTPNDLYLFLFKYNH